MGMYTEIHFNSELKNDVPQSVVDVLRYMLGEVEEEPSLPDHPLFQCARWRVMLRMDSYYFDADTHSTLRKDKISESYYLCIRSNLKNYSNEIDLFVDWITPHLEKHEGDFLGFKRYEEDETPTLIYHQNRFVLAEEKTPSDADLLAAANDMCQQLQDEAERMGWILDNPGLAILFLSEATNNDTYGKLPDEDIPMSRVRAYIRERIDDERSSGPSTT